MSSSVTVTVEVEVRYGVPMRGVGVYFVVGVVNAVVGGGVGAGVAIVTVCPKVAKSVVGWW
jgi:hypothetical protein